MRIEVITGGGRNSFLLSDWGAEKSENRHFFRIIKQIVAQNNWSITKVNPPELAKSFMGDQIRDGFETIIDKLTGR
ncbi:MAG TPA: hypothetical protein PLZ08_04740 [Bacillota bacterium]|nr:hypothetical protein [Bacillota bacterium]HOL09590.1 hypothetical protein [Bacillota bacterium]HPO97249.1 hypothetical protein [Bacillota bacterium]